MMAMYSTELFVKRVLQSKRKKEACPLFRNSTTGFRCLSTFLTFYYRAESPIQIENFWTGNSLVTLDRAALFCGQTKMSSICIELPHPCFLLPTSQWNVPLDKSTSPFWRIPSVYGMLSFSTDPGMQRWLRARNLCYTQHHYRSSSMVYAAQCHHKRATSS
jgi:hypothetical protein